MDQSTLTEAQTTLEEKYKTLKENHVKLLKKVPNEEEQEPAEEVIPEDPYKKWKEQFV